MYESVTHAFGCTDTCVFVGSATRSRIAVEYTRAAAHTQFQALLVNQFKIFPYFFMIFHQSVLLSF